MNNAVTLFGIRHHGPGSAHSLRQALNDLRPDILLIEGPPDAESIIPWVNNPDLQPPVAILLYAPDQPRKSAFYPFAEFSPEWQAMKYGLEQGIPIRFMDLPQSIQLAIPTPDAEEQPISAVQDQKAAPVFNDPLSWLAEIAGYEDGETWWEALVEQRRENPADLFCGIQEMMTVLRSEVEQISAGVSGAYTATSYEAEREAYMRQTIREAQSSGYQKIAVVCGAWHTPALNDLSTVKEDQRKLEKLAKIETRAAWVPWSNGRLAMQSGYGAGIESPGWYELLWQTANQGLSRSNLSILWMTMAAHALRKEDLPASSAQSIEAVRLADALASMRGLSIPGLAELMEAIQTVFCSGEALPLQLIHDKLMVREWIGKVPDDVPATPLQTDLARHQKSLRLPPEASFRDLDLDLRKPNDLERSYLLHRLNILDIPWGVLQKTSGKSGTFHELWRLQWNPGLAVKVVEASLWGNTVETAAIAFIRSAAEKTNDLSELTERVNQALLGNLPDAVQYLMERLDAEAAQSSDIVQMMSAFPALVEILRYGSVRQMDTAMITRVVDGLFARICVGLPPACASLDDDSAAEIFKRIIQTQHGVALLQNEAYLQEWQGVLVDLANQSGLHGLITGRACAILLEQKVFSPQETSLRFSRALSSANKPELAAAWVEGLLNNAGSSLIHEDALFQIIDNWLPSLPEDTFIQVLPVLRRTFSTFTPPERRMIGERARKGAALHSAISTVSQNFDTQRAEAVLPLLSSLLGLPAPTNETQRGRNP